MSTLDEMVGEARQRKKEQEAKARQELVAAAIQTLGRDLYEALDTKLEERTCAMVFTYRGHAFRIRSGIHSSYPLDVETIDGAQGSIVAKPDDLLLFLARHTPEED